MPNDDWMAAFTTRTDLSLTDLAIPASHDAGVSPNHYSGYTKLSSKSSTIAQLVDIAGQLSAGSRFFDLRIAKKGSKLCTFHGEGVFGGVGGGWGQDAESIFDSAKTFVEAHTGEIVILRISHTDKKHNVGASVRATIPAAQLYTCDPSVNLANVTLDQLKGKVIAIFDKGALDTPNPAVGLHRFSKYSGESRGGGVQICGKYAGITAGLHKMVQTTVKSANEHGTHMKFMIQDHLFMAYWQLAFNIENKTMAKADQPNPRLAAIDATGGTHFNLDYLLNAHRGTLVSDALDEKGKHPVKPAVTRQSRTWHRPNLINLDCVTEEVCNKVIAFNTELLPPKA